MEEAEAEKLRLEQKQRETRKRMLEKGESWKPLWFEQRTAGKGAWTLIDGLYWKSRAESFKGVDIPSIY